MPAPAFLIGVFSQPVSSFDKWKALGINTLISAETEGGRLTRQQWEDAAAQAGLFFMDYPAEDDVTLKAQAGQPFRIGFMQDDEPDLTRDAAKYPQRFLQDGPYRGWTRPEVLQERYRRCKVAAPQLPVLVNFAGPQVTPEAYTHGQGHKAYIGAADWLAHDWYVKNKNAQRYPIDLIAKAMDRLAAWSASPQQPAGKPQLVFIECSEQRISDLGRCPTADEVEQEVNVAMSRGARGIVYFPQRPPPGFSFDAMPQEIVERVVRINARLLGGAPQTPDAMQAVLDRLMKLADRLDGIADRWLDFTQTPLHGSFDLRLQQK